MNPEMLLITAATAAACYFCYRIGALLARRDAEYREQSARDSGWLDGYLQREKDDIKRERDRRNTLGQFKSKETT